jgi:hypothetical protein
MKVVVCGAGMRICDQRLSGLLWQVGMMCHTRLRHELRSRFDDVLYQVNQQYFNFCSFYNTMLILTLLSTA